MRFFGLARITAEHWSRTLWRTAGSQAVAPRVRHIQSRHAERRKSIHANRPFLTLARLACTRHQESRREAHAAEHFFTSNGSNTVCSALPAAGKTFGKVAISIVYICIVPG